MAISKGKACCDPFSALIQSTQMPAIMYQQNSAISCCRVYLDQVLKQRGIQDTDDGPMSLDWRNSQITSETCKTRLSSYDRSRIVLLHAFPHSKPVVKPQRGQLTVFQAILSTLLISNL